jgi:hypothetical protein
MSDDPFGLGAAPVDAREFLAASMEFYASLVSFEAKITVRLTEEPEEIPPQVRELYFLRPNRFRVVSSRNRLTMTCVCDGQTLVETSSGSVDRSTVYDAPIGIWESRGKDLSHSMFCGSVLYQFFGGSGCLTELANLDKAPIRFEDDEFFAGEVCKVVQFCGSDRYGNVRVLIGVETGFVHRISYDSAAFLARMADPKNIEEARRRIEAKLAGMPPGDDRDRVARRLQESVFLNPPAPAFTHVESYRNIRINGELPDELFRIPGPIGL